MDIGVCLPTTVAGARGDQLIEFARRADRLGFTSLTVVDRLVYDFKTPQPGDVVVFKGPPGWTDNEVQSGAPTSTLGKIGDWSGQLIGLTPASEVDFVKRVIAVGGQSVYCCDANNHVVVDGKPLIEPYLYEDGRRRERWTAGRSRTQSGSLTQNG